MGPETSDEAPSDGVMIVFYWHEEPDYADAWWLYDCASLDVDGGVGLRPA